MGSVGDPRSQDDTRALSADSARAIRRAGELVITAWRIAAESYVMQLAGELDAATRSAAEEELAALRRDGRDIAVDLSELEFLDSSGLRLLLDVTSRTDGSSPVRLVSASAAVRRLAELTGTAERLGI